MSLATRKFVWIPIGGTMIETNDVKELVDPLLLFFLGPLMLHLQRFANDAIDAHSRIK